jgi:hypothetical protein
VPTPAPVVTEPALSVTLMVTKPIDQVETPKFTETVRCLELDVWVDE